MIRIVSTSNGFADCSAASGFDARSLRGCPSLLCALLRAFGSGRLHDQRQPVQLALGDDLTLHAAHCGVCLLQKRNRGFLFALSGGGWSHSRAANGCESALCAKLPQAEVVAWALAQWAIHHSEEPGLAAKEIDGAFIENALPLIWDALPREGGCDNPSRRAGLIAPIPRVSFRPFMVDP